MARSAFIIPEYDLAIFWSPKAACSSIAAALTISLYGPEQIQRLKERSIGPLQFLKEEGYQTTGYDALRKSARHGYKTAVIMRDPYDRLISAFVNKFVANNHRTMLRFRDMGPFAIGFLRDHSQVLGMGDKLDLRRKWTGVSFRQFTNTVCSVIDDTPDRGRRLNRHWNTQVPQEFKDQKFEFDETYDLKDIHTFFDQLKSYSQHDLNFLPRNPSPYSKTQSPCDLCDMSSVEILKQSGFSKECFDSKVLRDHVSKSFKTDYFYLGKAA